jgi:hypothetical protein
LSDSDKASERSSLLTLNINILAGECKMKITELVMESRKIDEAPMGMLNKLGNKVMSKFGSDTSTGKLKSGDVANKLYSAFNQYLGQSGQQPTWPVVSKWLQSNKYPIKMAQKVVQGAKADAAIPQGPSTMDRVKSAGRSALDKGKELGNRARNAMKPTGTANNLAGAVSEAVAAPLDKKTLEKVFMASAQEAAVVVQQRKQGGGQQNQRQGNNGQQGGLNVQQGGKSQGGDAKLAQRVDNLEAEVAALKGSSNKNAA